MSYTVEDRLISPNVLLGFLLLITGVFFFMIHIILTPDIPNWYFYIWIGLIIVGVYIIIPQ